MLQRLLRLGLENDLARVVWFKFYFAAASYPYSKSGAYYIMKFRRLATAIKRRIKLKFTKRKISKFRAELYLYAARRQISTQKQPSQKRYIKR